VGDALGWSLFISFVAPLSEPTSEGHGGGGGGEARGRRRCCGFRNLQTVGVVLRRRCRVVSLRFKE
jgi:hypothetical protein